MTRRPRGAVLAFVAGGLIGLLAGGLLGSAVLLSHPRLAARAAHLLARARPVGSALGAQATESNVAGVTITVDAGAEGTAISPLIYGVAAADGDQVRALGAGLDRWGGNPNSRFNWAIGHAWNAARDWGFRNGNYAAPAQGSASDRFYQEAAQAEAAPLMTVPMLGWVARNDDNGTASVGVPPAGGPATSAAGAIAGYDPAANRARTSVQSLARKPGPFVDAPDPAASAVYQDEFIHHLVAHFPNAATGYFALDNEPDLWSTTHTDVHPARMGYDEMLRVYLDYAGAVREQAPNARLLGPDVSGWTYYWYSDLDRGSDNFAAHADRAAHGGRAFLPWWLSQVAAHDRAAHTRTLDLLDVHYYPQASGVYSSAHDAATQSLRMRSTRSLWDAGYQDESWIADRVMLIPRLKDWIATSYPGLGVAISEYSFGGEEDQSGAAAEAMALGIFGREGVQLASYWTHPKPGSPTDAAFRLYRNPDGRGPGFGDLSIPVRSSSPGIVAYAARHRTSGEVDVMLVNQSVSQTGSAAIAGLAGAWTAAGYQTAGGTGRIEKRALARAADPISLPPMSVTLVRLVRS